MQLPEKQKGKRADDEGGLTAMPEKEKKEFVDYDEKIIDDEMQRLLSYELEHKTLCIQKKVQSL